ncbi:MAG: ArsR/SmtB family transcription factor [Gaiellales bacterium]
MNRRAATASPGRRPDGHAGRRLTGPLRQGARAVGDLAGDLPVSRPAVSQHLRVLKEAGLVRARRAGTRRLYEPDPAGLEALRTYLETFWESGLEDFKTTAEGRRGREP